jgi:anti-sigma-K factor RskA
MTEQPHARDLLAAYVLDAVTPPEAALVESHLATCAACRALETELREAAARLPALAGELEPPPSLKARLMDTVAREANDGASSSALPRGAGDSPIVARPGVEPARVTSRAARPPGWARSPLVALAALVVLLLVSAGLWRAYRDGQPRPTSTYAMAGTQLQPAIGGSLAYYGGDRSLTLDLHGLASLHSDRVYELWLVRGHYRVVAGIAAFRPGRGGTTHLTVQGQVVPAYTMACLTVERAPLARRPTLPLVALAQING